MRNKYIVLILAIILIILFTSCSASKGLATNIGKQYYSMAQQRDFGALEEISSESILSGQSVEYMKAYMKLRSALLGNLQEYKLKSSNKESSAGSDVYHLIYNVQYDNASGTEELSITVSGGNAKLSGFQQNIEVQLDPGKSFFNELITSGDTGQYLPDNADYREQFEKNLDGQSLMFGNPTDYEVLKDDILVVGSDQSEAYRQVQAIVYRDYVNTAEIIKLKEIDGRQAIIEYSVSPLVARAFIAGFVSSYNQGKITDSADLYSDKFESNEFTSAADLLVNQAQKSNTMGSITSYEHYTSQMIDSSQSENGHTMLLSVWVVTYQSGQTEQHELLFDMDVDKQKPVGHGIYADNQVK